jgi:hypothetical protein
MTFLSDEEARQIATQLPAPRDERDGLIPPTLVMLRWLRQLLDDRRERSDLILGLSRHMHHMRERLRDAGTYFDKMASDGHKLTLIPWPASKTCKRCGAPFALQVEPRRRDPALPVTGDVHPDGKKCEQAERTFRTQTTRELS